MAEVLNEIREIKTLRKEEDEARKEIQKRLDRLEWNLSGGYVEEPTFVDKYVTFDRVLIAAVSLGAGYFIGSGGFSGFGGSRRNQTISPSKEIDLSNESF